MLGGMPKFEHIVYGILFVMCAMSVLQTLAWGLTRLLT